ncbi:MAG: ABC transporter substrate-binding protein [Candidatus Thorarchaeota archaeon]|jgi:peptide/nickel transport system substrate-binding protein
MEQNIMDNTRVCQIPPSQAIRKYEHQKPWPVIMAVGIIAILSVSAFSPFLFWAPIQSPIPGTDTLVYHGSEYLTLGYNTFDPAWADTTSSMMYVSNCYDTLVAYDRQRMDRFRPLLVTEVPSLENGRISPDGLTYRFTIRGDSPLTPEDVEYSFERLMVCGGSWANPTYLLHEVLLGVCPFSFIEHDTLVSFEDIDSAVEVEGNDVVFHLARTCPQFMQLLASSCSSILSKAWCVEAGDWSGTEETWHYYRDNFRHNVRTNQDVYSPLQGRSQRYGPFILERNSPVKVVLVRNEDYWRGPARLERVEFKSSGDHWEPRKQKFLEGYADICPVPEENYAELDGVDGIRIYTGLPTLEYLEMYLNIAIANISPYIGSGELDGTGIPPDFFSDIDVRKALAYSIDYDTIINEVYAGEAMQPTSPVLEGLPFHNPDQEGYTYDLDKARQHFQQAWGGEVWNKGFNLTLVFLGFGGFLGPVQDSRMFMLAETLKDSIETINTNFHVTLQPEWMPHTFWIPSHEENLTACFGSFPHTLSPLFSVTLQPELYSSILYANTTVVSLIEVGMNTVNSTERQTIYYELQRIYHDDVLGIPLVQPLTRHYQRDCVWGWYHNPAAGMDFYEMLKGTYQDATMNIIVHVEGLVDSGVLGAYAGSSLNETLYSAMALMDIGNLTEASQKLNDFIDQVNALDLPVWDGEELIALAQEIIEVLLTSPSSTLLTQASSFPDIGPVVGVPIATIARLLVRKMKRK